MMKKPFNRSLAGASSGFTLIEVLVALLVLSIALLGMAGLQVSSTRLTHEAHLRSVTTVTAADIIDKIRMRTARVNDPGVKSGIVASYATVVNGDNCVPGVSSVTNDLECWQRTIKDALPEGQGEIISNGGNAFTVTISWYDRDSEEQRSVDWNMRAGS